MKKYTTLPSPLLRPGIVSKSKAIAAVNAIAGSAKMTKVERRSRLRGSLSPTVANLPPEQTGNSSIIL